MSEEKSPETEETQAAEATAEGQETKTDHVPVEGEKYRIEMNDGTVIRLKRLPRGAMDEVMKLAQENRLTACGKMILDLCMIGDEREVKAIRKRLEDDDGFFMGATMEALSVIEYIGATLKKN